MSEGKIHWMEKSVISIALTVAALHLGLIATAAYFWGATVPDCVQDVKPFTESSLAEIAPNHYELHVVAKMWEFDPKLVRFPKGAVVDVFLSSKDVTHGFQILGTNLNLMAVPGAVNRGRVTFKNEGQYRVVCHEYCGVGHQAMFSTIEVSDAVMKGFIADQKAEPAANLVAENSGDKSLLEGQKIYQEKACIGCHSRDGSQVVGPTFKGLFGSKVELADGSSITVDEAYLKESINEPQKKIVKGFEGIPMPKMELTEEEVKSVIKFIESLK